MTRKVWTALNVIEILRLHLFLVGFPVVKIVEVAHNDGHRQSDCQNPGNGTQGPNDFPPHTHGPRLEQ